ncbi:Ferredoxin [Pedobacter suwonensis]|uniref:Ferredoxin n=1 Tax=Pedobacter suwonensis TaxID=332999 RepID=A0A1I0SQ00_9SPHI|nr:4Fe-4S binding protein [Pedobacter suwonensis]SFA41487.1 Ferredoxin [Pedobacter suwonensis]
MVTKIFDSGSTKVFEGTGLNPGKITFEGDACIQCGLCVPECPNDALLYDETLLFYPNRCTLDGSCAEVCPVEAIICEGDQQCKEDALNDFFADVSSDATTVGISESSGSANQRVRNYSWIFFKQIYGLWRWTSYEIGTQKRVLMPSGQREWHWEEIKHDHITWTGNYTGYEMTGVVDASPATLGIYYSGITLQTTFTVHLICNGFPFPSSFSVQSKQVWHVDAPFIGQ